MAAFVSLEIAAQGAKVLNAYNYMQDGDFIKAKAEIDPAIEHPKTKEQAKTWYYRGQIYENLYLIQDEKYKPYKEGALLEAMSSYAKALELGGNKINENEVRSRYGRLSDVAFGEGVNQYNAKNYTKAIEYFQAAFDTKGKLGIMDTLALYNMAISAERLKNYDLALKHYTQLKDVNYKPERVFPDMAYIYQDMKDNEKALAIISEGRTKLPNNQELITTEINIYLQQNRLDEALANLNLAIEQDPGNKLLNYARGTIYNNKFDALSEANKQEEAMKAFKNAEADYKKAIELDSNYFEAYYNLGALYFNHGAELINEANLITDDAKYKTAKAVADTEIKKALPYLERAHALNPEDVSTMQSLRELYARTNNMDKYNKLNEKLKN